MFSELSENAEVRGIWSSADDDDDDDDGGVDGMVGRGAGRARGEIRVHDVIAMCLPR